MYLLLGSAKLNGLDPETYLYHVLERIADQPISRVNDLLPWKLSTPPRTLIAYVSTQRYVET